MPIPNIHFGPALALILSLGFASPIISAAEPASQQRLQQIRGDINEIKQGLGSDKKKQQQQQQELSTIEKEIARLNQARKKTQHELKQQKTSQKQLINNTSKLRKKLEQQQHKLRQQTRAAYTAGRQQQLKLLLNQTNPASAGRNMTYYNYFNRAQINATNQTQTDIEQLSAAETQLQQSRDKLERLMQQQRQQNLKLQQRQSQRKTLLSKLNSQINTKEQQLKQLQEDESALSKLLQNLPSQTQGDNVSFSNLSKLKGKLKWPTTGKINNRFGSPRNQGQMKWQGTTIAGKEDQKIRSIAPGRVIFADWIRGYGLMLIIDHNNGYMSLYGHNKMLYKDVGDTISSNETIATLGNSSDNNSPYLYFEMRHKGKPVDPAMWCR